MHCWKPIGPGGAASRKKSIQERNPLPIVIAGSILFLLVVGGISAHILLKAPQREESQPIQPAISDEAEKQKHAAQRVQELVRKLFAATTSVDRLVSYRELQAAAKETHSAGSRGDVAASPCADGTVESYATRIDELKPVAEEPFVEPKWEEPKYEGARHISGAYRGPYGGPMGEEGIVISSGGRYYVIMDALPPALGYVHGYVTPVGTTVTLNIGGGREAGVYKLTDAQEAQADRASYRKEVTEARAEYRKKLTEYKGHLRNGTRPDITARQKMQRLEAERDHLTLNCARKLARQ
jgi:hypothetical protein